MYQEQAAIFEELKQLDQVLETTMAPEYAKDNNIHLNTGLLGSLCKTHFILIDDKYNLSKKNSDGIIFEQVATEILSLATTDHPTLVTNIQTVLDTIRTSGDSIEPETGLYVQDLLIRTWALIKHQLMMSYADAKEVIIDNLNHNIQAGGGCLAGISARLTHPYCCFVRHIFDLKQNLSHELEESADNVSYPSNRPRI